MSKIKFSGKCHCAGVQFEVELKNGLTKPRRCNCSICEQRGAVVVSTLIENFTITSGEDFLTLYQFNTHKAKHYFCSKCGIYAHHQRRSVPTEYAINVATLDDVSPFDFNEVPVFEGREHPRDKDNQAKAEVYGVLSFLNKKQPV